MRPEDFQHEVIETSKVLGKVKEKVLGKVKDTQVIFAGNQAATDGKTVWLPELGGGEISNRARDVMRGYVDHESGGHQLFSDMPYLMRLYKRYLKAGRSLAEELENAMEDMWIEPQTMRHYPGSNRSRRRHDLSTSLHTKRCATPLRPACIMSSVGRPMTSQKQGAGRAWPWCRRYTSTRTRTR